MANFILINENSYVSLIDKITQSGNIALRYCFGLLKNPTPSEQFEIDGIINLLKIYDKFPKVYESMYEDRKNKDSKQMS